MVATVRLRHHGSTVTQTGRGGHDPRSRSVPSARMAPLGVGLNPELSTSRADPARISEGESASRLRTTENGSQMC